MVFVSNMFATLAELDRLKASCATVVRPTAVVGKLVYLHAKFGSTGKHMGVHRF